MTLFLALETNPAHFMMHIFILEIKTIERRSWLWLENYK